MKFFYWIITIFLTLQLTSAFSTVSENNGRITNGLNVTQISDFPYMVSIQRGMNGFWQHICGGVIISNQAILTAGSCFTRNFYAIHRIRAGILYYNDPLTIGQTINIESVRIQQDFENNPLTAFQDIAVLILRSPLNLATQHVRSRELPAANWGTPALPNPSIAILTGWGSTTDLHRPQLSGILQSASVTFTTTCPNFITTGNNQNANVFCSVQPTQGNNLATGCTGDVGSPLLMGNQIVGILSRYQTPCNSLPALYTRVNVFRNFVIETLSDYNINLN